MSNIDWEKAAASGFADLTDKQLIEACSVFGIPHDKRNSADTVREKLCAASGAVATKAVAKPAVGKGLREFGKFDPLPNLTDSGRWGGRRHRIIIPNTEQNKNSRRNGLGITWGRSYLFIFFDREQDIPEPHFNILKDARGAQIQSVRKVRDDGSVEIVNETRPYQAYPYQYSGVTPGTEDLPVSIKDYWQRQARKHDNFQGCDRRMLMSIRANLIGQAPGGRAYFKNVDDEDIRIELLEALHIDELEAA